ncbi:phage tail tape measure protein [Actinobacillus genomosp. 2]|uniref:phage tail tape measure protein n=1 Tax=Actinobacillus genomosp. 2 TaxID=230709 RepID=UPI0024426631|nr:phage tail tape measure protein [Actinobacillus genomosp. 2]WGE32557.1 phage tail tape measure protein [Actinobacillus genomosp. 2]
MAIQGLEYIISLNDQLSTPLKGIMKSIDDIGIRGRDAMTKIGVGVAGIIGAGAGIANAFAPAVAMSNELGKIKGLGESEEGLRLMRKRAMEFSNTWGEAATDFINSSYDIKSAIDGLTTEELASFTELSAVTGKATQTQAQTMTDYLGTMYSVLGASKEADKIKWAEKLMGQTAYTANKFKSDGAKIAQAFQTLGNQATLAGVDIAEQFAILGTLQNEMGGGESATKYAAFLNSIGKASEDLGIKVHDSQDRLLSTLVILDRIRAKFGNSIDDIEAQLIKGEMGRKEGVAFINTLLSKNEDLKISIAEIGKINGMDEVYAGAKANIDVFARLSNILINIRTAIGSALLEKFEPVFNKLADMGQAFTTWLGTYRNIARWIGYAAIALLGFTAVAGSLILFSGIFGAIKVSLIALISPVSLFVGSIIFLSVVLYKLRDQFAAIFSGFVNGFKHVGIATEPLMNALGTIKTALIRMGASVISLFNAFFGVSDGMTTFGMVGEAVGIIVANGLNGIIRIIDLIASNIAIVADIFEGVANAIITAWQGVVQGWQNSDPIQIFGALAQGVTDIFTSIFSGLKNMFINTLNWLITQANKLGSMIGVEIPLYPVVKEVQQNNKPVSGGLIGVAQTIANSTQNSTALPKPNSNGQHFALPASTQAEVKPMPQGSVSKNMTMNQNNSKTVHIGSIVVNEATDARQLAQQIKDNAGLMA